MSTGGDHKYLARTSQSVLCETRCSHLQSSICIWQTLQNPPQDNIKLIHTSFQNVDSISSEDISSATSRCIVNKTCIYRCPQNVLTRSFLTVKDNICHYAMSNYCKETLIFFFPLYIANSRKLTTNKYSYLQKNSKCKISCSTSAKEQ